MGLHYLKGALFENLIINEFIKQTYNRGDNRMPYFWQDSQGREIDCLLVDGEQIAPIEIKSGKTISNHYFDNLNYWSKLLGIGESKGLVIYGGDQTLQTGAGKLVSWKQLEIVDESISAYRR